MRRLALRVVRPTPRHAAERKVAARLGRAEPLVQRGLEAQPRRTRAAAQLELLAVQRLAVVEGPRAALRQMRAAELRVAQQQAVEVQLAEQPRRIRGAARLEQPAVQRLAAVERLRAALQPMRAAELRVAQQQAVEV